MISVATLPLVFSHHYHEGGNHSRRVRTFEAEASHPWFALLAPNLTFAGLKCLFYRYNNPYRPCLFPSLLLSILLPFGKRFVLEDFCCCRGKEDALGVSGPIRIVIRADREL